MDQQDIVEYSKECNESLDKDIESFMGFHDKFKDSDSEIGEFIAKNSLEYVDNLKEFKDSASDFFELGRQ